MLLGQHFRRHDVGRLHLQLVLEADDDLRLALLHRLEAEARNVRGIVLLSLPDLGVHEIRTLEKLRVRRSRHQAGYRDARVLELVPQRLRERVHEGLARVVNRLERAGMKPAIDPVSRIRPRERVRIMLPIR
jgi:hypothetical protein